MKIYAIGSGEPLMKEIPDVLPEAGLFVTCRTGDVRELAERFAWDESTVSECVSADEFIRYTAYDGYDYISLIHMESVNNTIAQHEINLFVSNQYLVMVLPEQAGERLDELESAMSDLVTNTDAKPNSINRLYYIILN